MRGIRWIAALIAVVVIVTTKLATRSASATDSPADNEPTAAAQALPTEMGQATFAAVAEIVAMLESDPDTDWSKVDIAGLREHLVDMNRVMVEAQVSQRDVEGGVEMTVRGPDDVLDAARRMVQAHSSMMGPQDAATLTVDDRGDALVLTWTTDDQDRVAELRGLGFFGFLARGGHHQRHHLMLARGMNPHGG